MFYQQHHPVRAKKPGSMNESAASASALTSAAKAVVAGDHVGIFVLTSRVLWDLVTGFMDGYPYIVHKFYRESTPDTLVLDPRVGSLRREGVLLHLVITAGRQELLALLFKLTE